MLLKSLSLKNYRKFEDAFVEFPEGVTGIVGLNGAGKSTLFEAIAWVLYGSMGSRTSVDQIRSRGVDDSEVCRVCLEFVFADQLYSVTREMRGKGLVVHAVALVDGGVENVASFGDERVTVYFPSSYFTDLLTDVFGKFSLLGQKK